MKAVIRDMAIGLSGLETDRMPYGLSAEQKFDKLFPSEQKRLIVLAEKHYGKIIE